MIRRSRDFDLGQDKTRMKDLNDVDRQHQTVDTILERMFHYNPKERRELQLLADEVGMGKTFVALGVAYSILSYLGNGGQEEDLQGCYSKVLIITPQNISLFKKWRREVSEFVKRCVKPARRSDAEKWFFPKEIERIDELVMELRRKGPGCRVLVTRMNMFSRTTISNYDLKRRFLLGVLFRYWGVRFKVEERERLLKGAPKHWPNSPYELSLFDETQLGLLPFYEEDLLAALGQMERTEDGSAMVEGLLDECRKIAQPYFRDRDQSFQRVEARLVEIYRELNFAMIRKAFPLVIVDEAHNWKNGPSDGANGYDKFARVIAPNARRILLLTATPFQLRPEEMLEILKVSDNMAPCSEMKEVTARRERLRVYREREIKPALEKAKRASRHFSKEWTRLPAGTKSEDLQALWESEDLSAVRSGLLKADISNDGIWEKVSGRLIQKALASVPLEVRPFVREALRVYACNSVLSEKIGWLVIRHRRRSDHRYFLVGQEFNKAAGAAESRPDRNLLHAAAGLDVRGEGELPHYLLMRCVTEMKKGKGKSSLGSALTGCYSTLVDSAEGKTLQKHFSGSEKASSYFGLLRDLVDESQDPGHPKVRAVVDSVIDAWRHGEKSLLFCFRVNTAERLRDIINDRIRRELEQRRRSCLGGPESLKALRSRLTGREQDLIVLGLDRVLWSFFWLRLHEDPDDSSIVPEDFMLNDSDFSGLARLGLVFGVVFSGERVDRVFLTRATECVLANRWLREKKLSSKWKDFLSEVSKQDWVAMAYGYAPDRQSKEHEDGGGEERAEFDERGAHTVYKELFNPGSAAIAAEARKIADRRQRARQQGQIPIVDGYAIAPSLWLGIGPIENAKTTAKSDDTAGQLPALLARIHGFLWTLSMDEDGYDWESRRKIFQSLRRALLRESVLLRLLPGKTELKAAGWGELLVEAFYSQMPGQKESMADRIAVFLEDLNAASGSLSEEDKDSARYVLYDSTRLRDQKFVALVKGGGDPKERERVFAGFNTPLLPEILVCTEVGQEGIDLHRHCRHVVHYDLAWNPAVLEQRTGRVDRIGSKTFRERELNGSSETGPFLEIGVPFLAGTYDERMYEELRLRAQVFEVLTGGDFAMETIEQTRENPEGRDDLEGAEGKELGVRCVSMPETMIRDLRVKLNVWPAP